MSTPPLTSDQASLRRSLKTWSLLSMLAAAVHGFRGLVALKNAGSEYIGSSSPELIFFWSVIAVLALLSALLWLAAQSLSCLTFALRLKRWFLFLLKALVGFLILVALLFVFSERSVGPWNPVTLAMVLLVVLFFSRRRRNPIHYSIGFGPVWIHRTLPASPSAPSASVDSGAEEVAPSRPAPRPAPSSAPAIERDPTTRMARRRIVLPPH